MIAELAVATGTSPVQWMEVDDHMIATVLQVFVDRAAAAEEASGG